MLLTIGVLLCSGPFALAQNGFSIEDLYRIDHLPRLRTFVKVGSFSSYDRTGGNDDGFSGKYSFIRKEGDALVIAELQGPGVITRIWTATPNDSPLEFFFDNEKVPRLVLPFRDIFRGNHMPFLAPLAGSGGGGFYSYVPLPFQRSCKIRLRGPKMQFFQINYGLYEPGERVATFDPADGALRDEIAKVQRVWSSAAGYTAPQGSQIHRQEQILVAGKSATLFESAQGGRVVAIRLTPASAFAGPDRRLVLRATWDGDSKPAILAPVGDFFGYSFGNPSARSLLVGTEGDTAYAYFPMPFDRSARIEIVSERESGPPVHFASEVISTSEARTEDECRFYARWSRENPVALGQPFTFVDVEGKGHLVGVALQAQGVEPGQTYFFEGNDEATIDGELSIHGTGSEDFFNGGWYDIPGRWNGRLSLPLSGALDYQKAMGRTGGYRLMLADAYAFRKSLKLTIEHGPEGNRVPADYTAMSFFYLQRPPLSSPGLANASSRAVTDPECLVFVPGWNEPIYAFSFENMSLRKQEMKMEGGDVRVLSIEAQGEEKFGPHYIAFTVQIPKAGDYSVSVEALRGPLQGTVQLMFNNELIGNAASFAASSVTRADAVELGNVPLETGENQLFFRLGSEEGKSGSFHVDLIRIVCRRR
ncbi:MAG: glycoside hydrolase family 172 protein [Halobacteriota archaeon]|jgi:hypothetical protein